MTGEIHNSNDVLLGSVRPVLWRLSDFDLGGFYNRWVQHPLADPALKSAPAALANDGKSGVWAIFNDLQHINFEELRKLLKKLDDEISLKPDGYFTQARFSVERACGQLDKWDVWHGEVSDLAYGKCREFLAAAKEYECAVDEVAPVFRAAYETVHRALDDLRDKFHPPKSSIFASASSPLGEFNKKYSEVKAKSWLAEIDQLDSLLSKAGPHSLSREYVLAHGGGIDLDPRLLGNKNLAEIIRRNDQFCHEYPEILTYITEIGTATRQLVLDAWAALARVCDSIHAPKMQQLTMPGLIPVPPKPPVEEQDPPSEPIPMTRATRSEGDGTQKPDPNLEDSTYFSASTSIRYDKSRNTVIVGVSDDYVKEAQESGYRPVLTIRPVDDRMDGEEAPVLARKSPSDSGEMTLEKKDLPPGQYQASYDFERDTGYSTETLPATSSPVITIK